MDKIQIRIDKLPLPDYWKPDEDDVLEEIADIVEKDEKEIGLTCRPRREHIFRSLHLITPDKVKVVILGQDPYYNSDKNGNPNATGLAFGVFKGQPIPKSLDNIFEELKDDIPTIKKPTHGDLTYWAVQGVLLLNMSLTVLPAKEYANRHNEKKVWDEFTISVIEKVRRANKKCVYILWGKPAQDFGKKYIKSKKYVITGAHPVAMKGFFGGKYFSRCNELLIGDSLTPIDWQL